MDHEFLITMRLSFSLAFITTLILLPIGIFLGYFLSLKRNLLTSLTETLVYMPLVLPPSVLGFYLLLIFSPSSFLGAFLQDALNVKLVFSFQGLHPFFVLLPNIKPSLLMAIITTFTHTIGEFGVVMMLGGDILGETRVASIAILTKLKRSITLKPTNTP